MAPVYLATILQNIFRVDDVIQFIFFRPYVPSRYQLFLSRGCRFKRSSKIPDQNLGYRQVVPFIQKPKVHSWITRDLYPPSPRVCTGFRSVHSESLVEVHDIKSTILFVYYKGGRIQHAAKIHRTPPNPTMTCASGTEQQPTKFRRRIKYS